MLDSGDFAAFYVGSSQRILRQVYALTGDLSESEDAVAEAYIRAWQRWPQVSRCVSPEAWVSRVAARIAVSEWRKNRNRRQAHLLYMDGPTTDGLGPDRVAVIAALRRLPATHRRVIVLHHLADLSIAEISHRVGAPVGTVTVWLARGRRALARQLADR
jgi:RNA polymerase sigma-70 factor (ECF subfamily)